MEARIPLPEGMSEADYQAIEAAVMETVRGRWFLAEFARRGRAEEMRQMLEAVARLERIMLDQQASPMNPSSRLLAQRLKDIAQSLEKIGGEMRARSLDEKLCGGVETQSRALFGLLRLSGAAAQAPPAAVEARRHALPEPKPPAPQPEAVQKPRHSRLSLEMRRAALARLDKLSIGEKLALFA